MPSKETLQKALEHLIARFEKEMAEADLPPDLHMGINPPPASDLDEISRYDGTAGFNSRPDFVREEDERTGIKWHGTTSQ